MPTQSANAPITTVIERALAGEELTSADGYLLMAVSGPDDLGALMSAASAMNDAARPLRRVTYSRKVFLPLTNLCRDRCGYCTFVKGPHQLGAHTMTPAEVLSVAQPGRGAGVQRGVAQPGRPPGGAAPGDARNAAGDGVRVNA